MRRHSGKVLGIGILGIVLVILVSFVADRGPSPAFAQAREQERRLLMRGGRVTYADPAYLKIAESLAKVSPFSSDYDAARAKLTRIQEARRLKAGRLLNLDYIPTKLKDASLEDYAPPLPDDVSRLARRRSADASSREAAATVAADRGARVGARDEGSARGTGPEAGILFTRAPSPEHPAVDSAKPSETKSVRNESPTASADVDPVILYSTSWCGYCRKTRSYLRRRGVAFIDKDVERDPAAARELREKVGNYRGVPVLDIDGTIIRGFDVRRIDAALKRREGDRHDRG